MYPKIALPTDNIFKFYALFGLVLIVTAALVSAWVYDATFREIELYLPRIEKEMESVQNQINKLEK